VRLSSRYEQYIRSSVTPKKTSARVETEEELWEEKDSHII
jgi:hypothetical protein